MPTIPTRHLRSLRSHTLRLVSHGTCLDCVAVAHPHKCAEHGRAEEQRRKWASVDQGDVTIQTAVCYKPPFLPGHGPFSCWHCQLSTAMARSMVLTTSNRSRSAVDSGRLPPPDWRPPQSHGSKKLVTTVNALTRQHVHPADWPRSLRPHVPSAHRLMLSPIAANCTWPRLLPSSCHCRRRRRPLPCTCVASHASHPTPRSLSCTHPRRLLLLSRLLLALTPHSLLLARPLATLLLAPPPAT